MPVRRTVMIYDALFVEKKINQCVVAVKVETEQKKVRKIKRQKKKLEKRPRDDMNQYQFFMYCFLRELIDKFEVIVGKL